MGFEKTEQEKREALARNQPLLLSLYLDTLCNLRCKFCFLSSGKSHKQEQLSLQEYKDLISQGKELGVKSILFFGAGEPLLDEKLFPLIEYSNKLGLYSVMFTNASLVTREIAEKIKDLDLSVVASIKSRNPQILEKLTGIKRSAEKIYRGFKNLLDVGLNEKDPKRPGTTRLGINVLLCKPVYDEVIDLIRYTLANNLHIMVESMLWRGRAVQNYEELVLTPEQEKKLLEILKKRFPALVGERASLSGRYCDIDHYGIFVNYNGDVWQCFSRDIIAGNVKNQSLEEIWNSPKLKELRAKPVDPSCTLCPGRKYNLKRYLGDRNS